MRRVILESPYAGNLEVNRDYLNRAIADCLEKGEAPFASHKLYPDVQGALDDDPEQRRFGIEAGFAWRQSAEYTVVYADLGISDGMWKGIDHAKSIGHPVFFRYLDEWIMHHPREEKKR